MQYCKWCYFITDDFNRLIDDLERWYGKDQVAFLKVDGNLVQELSFRYQVMYFPHFVAIKPKTNGAEASQLRNGVRNYDTLKEWVLSVMGDTPIVDESFLQEKDSQVIKKVQDEIQ
jgi:hypothetical protein